MCRSQATLYIPYGRVLGTLNENRVDLADAARYRIMTALHQGFIGLTHVDLQSVLTLKQGSDTTQAQVFDFNVFIDAVP